jgi:acyl-CoA thioester hydrolase
MQPNLYQHQIQVEATDIDELNHVNNIVYLRYVQEVAQAHWLATASKKLQEQMSWVARRHEIDYLKQAFLGDSLLIKTWVESFSGVTTSSLSQKLSGWLSMPKRLNRCGFPSK